MKLSPLKTKKYIHDALKDEKLLAAVDKATQTTLKKRENRCQIKIADNGRISSQWLSGEKRHRNPGDRFRRIYCPIDGPNTIPSHSAGPAFKPKRNWPDFSWKIPYYWEYSPEFCNWIDDSSIWDLIQAARIFTGCAWVFSVQTDL